MREQSMREHRFYILYDERGPEDGAVLLACGEHRRLRGAVHECRELFDSGALYSYRVEGKNLVDQRFETSIGPDAA